MVYYIVCLISPPPGRPYVEELFGNEQTIIEGTSPSGTETPDDVEKSSVINSPKNFQS